MSALETRRQGWDLKRVDLPNQSRAPPTALPGMDSTPLPLVSQGRALSKHRMEPPGVQIPFTDLLNSLTEPWTCHFS